MRNYESFVTRLIGSLPGWAFGLAVIGIAAGCSFAPTGDAGRDQARVIAAGKTADVAREVEAAQSEKEAEEQDDAGKD